MIPIGLLTQVPAALSQAITPAAVPALSSIAATVPASASQWHGVANSVAQAWSDGDGESASRSLARAAAAATDLEGRAQVIDGNIAEGSSSIVRSIEELAQVAAQFVAEATLSISRVSAGPVGMAAAGVGLTSAATEAMTRAESVLATLAQDLAPITESLSSTANIPVDTPPAPLPAALSDAAEAQAAAAPATTPEEHATPEDTGDGSDANTAGAGAPTPEAKAAVENAMSALGTPYAWGGNTPGQGLDCSGLTHWAYGQAGVDIPRVAQDQAIGRQVGQDELLPGDLAVWDGHVAMVVGDGQMIEAGDPVQLNPVRTTNIGMPFKGFYRPTG